MCKISSGSRISQVGATTYYLAIFPPRKLYEDERNWTAGGGRGVHPERLPWIRQ